MRALIIAAAAFGLAGALAFPAAAQVTFDSSFESGNAENFTQVNANTWSFLIEPDTNSTDRQWFYFAVNGAEGQSLNFHLLETGAHNVTSHWNTARPVYSSDGGETWQHTVGPVSFSGGTYRFTHIMGSDSERLAFHFPYTWSMLQPKLAEWAEHPSAETSILGESIQGRPIHFFQVTSGEVGEPGEKLGIWVIARQHSAEVTGSYTVEAFMDYLLSDEEDARALRHNAVINVIPMINPDGVFAGNYRDNFAGVNLNRVWDGSANLTTSPEVVAAETKISEWVNAGHNYDLFLDIHSTSGTNPHFAFHAAASIQPSNYPTPETYHADSRAYLAFVNDYAPNFNPTAGTTTSNAQALAYHRQRIQYGVLAFTPEGAYNRQNFGPNSSDWMTPEVHRQVGVGFARAIVNYFDLEPPLANVDGWILY